MRLKGWHGSSGSAGQKAGYTTPYSYRKFGSRIPSYETVAGVYEGLLATHADLGVALTTQPANWLT